jgi:hypothetical protein
MQGRQAEEVWGQDVEEEEGGGGGGVDRKE